MTASPTLQPGLRVSLHEAGDVHRGTLRYVGPVAGGTYAGIDWDSPTRGKHDGIHDGKRYFSAREATSGSFLKLPPGAKGPRIDLGKGRALHCGLPFLTCVKQKYAEHSDADAVDPGSWGGKVVELIGWDKVARKQARLDALTEVSVAGLDCIAGSDEDIERIGEELPRVAELDVSRTLFPSLDSLGLVVARLPSLESLRAGANLFDELSCDPANGIASVPNFMSLPPSESPFRNVRMLALTHLLVPPEWKLLLPLLPHFPNLISLALNHNNLSRTALPEESDNGHSICTATDLSLEHCHLSSIPGFLAPFFPNLTKLNIANNPVAEIPTKLFANLDTLNLTSCNLASWDAITALDAWQLADIRLRGNPVLEGIKSDEVLPIVSARLSTPKRINGTDVSESDRTDAELWYASRTWSEPLRRSDKDKWEALHPRFWTIVGKHNLAYSKDAVEVEEKKGLAGRMVDVTIRVHRGAGVTSLKKKVPPTLSLQALLRMCAGKRASIAGVEIEREELGREIAWFLDAQAGEIDVYAA